MEYKCPVCSRLVYDRRRKSCGYCGACLPTSFAFSQEELDKLDAELELLAEQRQVLKLQEEAEEQQRQQAAQNAMLFNSFNNPPY
jgi:hypothetical protein